MMDKYDLLEAMGGIRDEYIEDASGLPSASGKTDQSRKAAARRPRIIRLQRWAASVAAILCLSVLVPNVHPGAASAFQNLPLVGNYFRAVTFRAYQYEDETSDAYVEEPGVVTMSSGAVKVEDDMESVQEENALAERSLAAGESGSAEMESAKAQNAAADEAPAAGAAAALADFSSDMGMDPGIDAGVDPSAVRAALSAARITEEIRQMAYDRIFSFETSLAQETGYQSLRFTHETVTDTDRWFCMEVYAYTSAADGFEQVTHFNIDKETGERVTLETWFGEETDYITPISENIIAQMRARMKADPDAEYWLDSKEEPEYDFTQILPDQDCYFDADGSLVICFNEGEAAPMYMGTVEFTIPQEITSGLR